MLMKKVRLKLTLLLPIFLLIVGCGVRGDPKPPSYPAELGRGRPSFKDPSRAMSYPGLPDAEELERRAKEEEEED